MRILILCTGNTCRSQMAEGFLQNLDKSLEVYSGGVEPGSGVNEYAVKVMKEKGIDLSGRKSSDVSEYIGMDFDFVITVCDHAKETCPVFTGDVKNSLHMGFEDPAEFEGTIEETVDKYKEIRDLIFNDFGNWYEEEIAGWKQEKNKK